MLFGKFGLLLLFGLELSLKLLPMLEFCQVLTGLRMTDGPVLIGWLVELKLLLPNFLSLGIGLRGSIDIFGRSFKAFVPPSVGPFDFIILASQIQLKFCLFSFLDLDFWNLENFLQILPRVEKQLSEFCHFTSHGRFRFAGSTRARRI